MGENKCELQGVKVWLLYTEKHFAALAPSEFVNSRLELHLLFFRSSSTRKERPQATSNQHSRWYVLNPWSQVHINSPKWHTPVEVVKAISIFPSSTKQLLQDRPLTIFLQADKLRAQQQLEQLQARYVGTGHADTTKFEWTSNIQRDSYASYVGHPPLLSYMAIGMGECREKVRAQMIEVSALITGPIFYGSGL